MLVQWLVDTVSFITKNVPEGSFLSHRLTILALLAVVLVSLVSGVVGSLVVGNRMAFFSDALAHCAFAGVALGLLTGLFFAAEVGSDFYEIGVPLIMVAFGIVVGLGIAFVREQTTLASDTVIGVFFAGALGFGAVLLQTLAHFRYFNAETFLFGAPTTAREGDILVLLGLVAVTLTVLGLMYNRLVFSSFNASLARSRNIPLRLCNYLFIILLALIVNLSLKIVGVLLINAMLIVPAATAANLCRNLRQLFWTTVLISVSVGVVGLYIAQTYSIPLGERRGNLSFGCGGLIVVLSVLLFFLSMIVGPRWRNRPLS